MKDGQQSFKNNKSKVTIANGKNGISSFQFFDNEDEMNILEILDEDFFNETPYNVQKAIDEMKKDCILEQYNVFVSEFNK